MLTYSGKLFHYFPALTEKEEVFSVTAAVEASLLKGGGGGGGLNLHFPLKTTCSLHLENSDEIFSCS